MQRSSLALRQPAPLFRGITYPIAEMRPELKADPEEQLLLYCGTDQGGWRLGVFHDGCWRDFTNLDEVLEPSHFALRPEDPE